MIKLVVFDFDGVFTDGKFYFNNSNIISKCYNAKDSYSLKLLKKKDIKCGIITNDKIVSIKNAPHIFERLDKCSLGQDRLKIDILNEWVSDLNIKLEEVAYIGDDIADISVLKNVGFSGSPKDAIKSVKDIVDYVCENECGNGAVREFVELIIKNNSNNFQIKNEGKITAVIPVRKGSTRCKNKNMRDFGDTNLLKLKIKILKEVKGIDEILVSSNCNEMLSIAKNMGVNIHKRDEKYCTNENPGDFFCNLAKNIKTNILMHVPVTTPFIKVNDYEKIITTWNNIKDEYDSLNTTCKIKEFIWYKNKPVNYDRKNPPPSQNLPEYAYLNFGCNIINKDNVLELNNVVGEKPYFFNIDNLCGIDIDHNSDFLIAELMYKNNIIDEEICNLILKKRNNNKLELLDCTIRDGGYLNNWNFTTDEVLDCYKSVSKSGYSYFEIGFKTNKKYLPNKGEWCYCDEKSISKIVEKLSWGCKIAVMAKIGTVDIEDFVERKNSNIDLVRVLLARITKTDNGNISKFNVENVKKAKEFCEKLIEYGYEVCMNFGCGDLIDDNEIKIIAKEFNNVKLKAIYIADTFGGFNEINIPIQTYKLYTEFNKYKSEINFGFHFHNNNNNALSKAKIAIYNGCNMIDTCIGGLGRGSGNLKSIELLLDLNGDNIRRVIPLIEFYEKHIISKKKYNKDIYIQSHPYYMIAGILSLHPNYIMEILLNEESEVERDVELIMKIDKYTKENNKRNYDKNLLKTMY